MVRTFYVPGEPRGKERPRFNSRTRRTYTPDKTVEYEREIAIAYKQKFGAAQFDGPVGMIVVAKFKIPKGTTRDRRRGMMAGTVRPTRRPDGDNIIKAVADALNHVAYNDDSQLVDVSVQKWYAEEPGIQVVLYDLGRV